ncbi:uncharacterized protein LOC129593644 isoform X1 [Paramacrobiotus metropolitanus]|uniref:uncharacterized protein LOC129593644 isoform X1 n=1 Tax=Paramacrobiotus metropolitanus TaxID=2943436 RepID=UPI002445D623|nr:uncharacterized protein LOC129593644 isoform X1 [Paramacrobiotus metropolitanus]
MAPASKFVMICWNVSLLLLVQFITRSCKSVDINSGTQLQQAAPLQLDLRRRKSHERVFKPDTNERYIAAEHAIGDGVKKKKNAKDAFDLSDFYNPKSWESMLSDNDYQELDATLRQAKSAQWANEKKRADIELDEDYAETDENDTTEEELDVDYEPAEVPAVDVQLDEESAARAQMDADDTLEERQTSSGDTADNIASWMDVFGADPEYARSNNQQDDTVMDKWLMRDEANAVDQAAAHAGENSGHERDDAQSDDVDPVYDVESSGSATREKRSYRSYDDDYGSAYIRSEDDKKAGNMEDTENDKSYSDEQTDVEEDITGNNQLDVDDTEESRLETTGNNVNDEEELDNDSTQVDAKKTNTEDDNLMSVDDNSEKSEENESRKKNRKRIKTNKASFDDDYEDILAASDRYRRLKSRKKQERQFSSQYYPNNVQYRKGHTKNIENSDSQGENVYAGDALEADASSYNWDQGAQRSSQYKTEYYPDRKISDGSLGRGKVHHYKNLDNSAEDGIVADADVDYVYRDEFENYEKSRGSPLKRRDRTKTSSSSERQKMRRKRKDAKEAVEFDDDYQFESEGTVEYARQKVCSFVAQQLPNYGFTGVMKPATSQCDVLCERSNGKQTVFHTFHLKNWPCGEDQKGRCSNDGKCDEVSYQADTEND